MRIVVVRHGQAAPKKGWAGKDDERPLTGRGRRQADRLERVIGPEPPTRVISSPALRCLQTVSPVASRHGLAVEVSAALATDAGGAAAELCHRLVLSPPATASIVLCTHREVLTELLPRLAKDFGRKPGHRLPGAKGGAWILRFDPAEPGRLQRIDYRPPAT